MTRDRFGAMMLEESMSNGGPMREEDVWTGYAVIMTTMFLMPAVFVLLSGRGWKKRLALLLEIYKFLVFDHFLRPVLWAMGIRWKWLH